MPLVKRDPPPAAGDAAEPSVEALLADLHDSQPQTRRGAARRLSEHPATVDALCAAVAAETEQSVRVALFTALIRVGTKAAAAGLVPLLQSEDVALRNGAIEALKTMPHSAAECISDIFAGSTDVRIFGVEILGALAHPDRQSWLIQIVQTDREVNVCAAAVEALVECGNADAVTPLEHLVARFPDEPFLEFSVRTALERIANL